MCTYHVLKLRKMASRARRQKSGDHFMCNRLELPLSPYWATSRVGHCSLFQALMICYTNSPLTRTAPSPCLFLLLRISAVPLSCPTSSIRFDLLLWYSFVRRPACVPSLSLRSPLVGWPRRISVLLGRARIIRAAQFIVSVINGNAGSQNDWVVNQVLRLYKLADSVCRQPRPPLLTAAHLHAPAPRLQP